MIVFRIQDRQGRGPWKPGFSHRWIRLQPNYDLVPWFEEWPGFDPVKEKVRREVIGTGCKTVEQLKRWFDRSEYTTLRILGYHAVKISGVRPLRESDNQVVFGREKPLNRDVEIIELYEH